VTRLPAFALAALLLSAGAAVALEPPRVYFSPQAAAGAPAGAFPAPDRPVAEIVSDAWWEEEKRDEAGESAKLIELMGLKPGMTVGDIGAGAGYHTVRLAPVLGPEGRVVAQDITAEYLQKLGERVKAAGLGNVDLALGEPADPRLAPASLDAAILVHMYHEVEQPYAFLYNLAPALKPGAKVGVIDLDRPTARHGTPLALLRCEFEAVGYRQEAVHDLGVVGYLAIFAAPSPEARPEPGAIKACEA